MKTLLKLCVLCVGIGSFDAMAMTKKECETAGGTYIGTVFTGTCTQKITAIRHNPAPTVIQITAEECKKQGGTVSNGNCVTITRFRTNEAPKAPQ